MNKNKFKAMVYDHGETMADLAQAMGLPQSALSARANGKTDFRQNELGFIKSHYGLTAREMEEIFFADVVSNIDTAGQPEEA